MGLSIGAAAPLDSAHLHRLSALLSHGTSRSRFPAHLAWSSHGGKFYNDLLPVPYDSVTLQRVCDTSTRCSSSRAGCCWRTRPPTSSTNAPRWTKPSFFRRWCAAAAAACSLDVNNAYVSAINHGRDARAFISSLPLAAVGEIHLAGFGEDRDAAGARLLIDTHGTAIDAAVWALCETTLRMAGPLPTLIERDNNIPSLAVLCAEARRADRALSACRARVEEAA